MDDLTVGRRGQLQSLVYMFKNLRPENLQTTISPDRVYCFRESNETPHYLSVITHVLNCWHIETRVMQQARLRL